MEDINEQKRIIKTLRNRWGSTTKDGIINLNSDLRKAPKDVIDYIIVHELCHLKVREHSQKFWRLVLRFMPNYYEKKRWLDKNGIKYE